MKTIIKKTAFYRINRYFGEKTENLAGIDDSLHKTGKVEKKSENFTGKAKTLNE